MRYYSLSYGITCLATRSTFLPLEVFIFQLVLLVLFLCPLVVLVCPLVVSVCPLVVLVVLSVGRFTTERKNRLLSNAFNSIKELNRLRKINRLLSKGMSNMYLKVTNKTFSKLRFSGFKKFVPGQVWEVPTHADIIEFQKVLLQLINKTSRSKSVGGFSIILILKKNMTF